MHSTDSLWGCDGEEEDTVAPLNDADSPQPPETWLMLEFCDRGSLLVRAWQYLSAASATSSLHLQDLGHVHSKFSGSPYRTCHTVPESPSFLVSVFGCVSLPFRPSSFHSALPFTLAFKPSNFAFQCLSLTFCLTLQSCCFTKYVCLLSNLEHPLRISAFCSFSFC